MVLGLKTKSSRKSASTNIDYVFYLHEIKPWPPSQSLKSLKSVVLQWDYGEKHSGSTKPVVPSIGSGSDGKIELNESFKLPVTLARTSSKGSGSYQKNTLELNLYEPRRDKTVKGQLLGTVVLDLAEYGVIKDVANICAPVNCRRSFKNTIQPNLYMKIQPHDKDSSGSSSRSGLPKEGSLDKESKESISALMNEEYAEEAEIASFTDDSLSSRGSPSSQKSPTFLDENADEDLESDLSGESSKLEEEASLEVQKDETVNSVGKNDLNMKDMVEENFINSKQSMTNSTTGQLAKRLSQTTLDDMQPTDFGSENGEHSVPEPNRSSISLASQVLSFSLLSASGSEDGEGRSHKSISSGGLNDIVENIEEVSIDELVAESNAEQELPVIETNSRSFIVEEFTDLLNVAKYGMDKAITQPEPEIVGVEDKSNSSESQSEEGEVPKRAHEVETVLDVAQLTPNPLKVDASHADDDALVIENGVSSKELKQVHADTKAFVVETCSREEVADTDSSSKKEFDIGNEYLPHNEQELNVEEDNSDEKKAQDTKATNDTSTVHEAAAPVISSRDDPEKVMVQGSDASAKPTPLVNGEKVVLEIGAAEKVEMDIKQLTSSGYSLDADEISDDDVIGKFTNPWKGTEINGKLDPKPGGELSTDAIVKETNTAEVFGIGVPSKAESQIMPGNDVKPLSKVSSRETLSTMTNDRTKYASKSVRSVLDNSGSPASGRISHVRRSSSPQISVIVTGRHEKKAEREHDRLKETGSSNLRGSGVTSGKILELESKIEKLEAELTEAAAVEVSLYSVIAEHGSSSHKVHTPARRLSRMYIHACKHWSHEKRASAARSAVSGLLLVAKACGNDVPRLTYWLSNSIVLRAIISQACVNIDDLQDRGNHQVDTSAGTKNGERKGSSLKWKETSSDRRKTLSGPAWEDPRTFTAAIENIETWLFCRIVESVWWQTLTHYMQCTNENGSTQLRKALAKVSSSEKDMRESFSVHLWKVAFRDAFERLCPVRAGGHDCGCLRVLNNLVMEQCLARLDVAMFNAILRDSDDDMPTDPVSDPISGSKVLPITRGSYSFGSGAMLKNAVGTWSRWLGDLFGTNANDYLEDENGESGDKLDSIESFYHLNALSDLLMLPKDMLLDPSMREEVSSIFAVPVLKRILFNFVPDEYCPDEVPEAVLEALNAEDELDEHLPSANIDAFSNYPCISQYPCSAARVQYFAPSAGSISSMIGDIQSYVHLKKNTSPIMRKCHTSDDELEELDSPLDSLVDRIPPSPLRALIYNTNRTSRTVGDTLGGDFGLNSIRYRLLREVLLEGD